MKQLSLIPTIRTMPRPKVLTTIENNDSITVVSSFAIMKMKAMSDFSGTSSVTQPPSTEPHLALNSTISQAKNHMATLSGASGMDDVESPSTFSSPSPLSSSSSAVLPLRRGMNCSRKTSATNVSSILTSRRHRQLLTAMAVTILTSTTPSTAAQEHKCPPNHSGWAPSADCGAYFWCSNGVLSSLPYNCVPGLQFSQDELTCVDEGGVDCEKTHQILNGEVAPREAAPVVVEEVVKEEPVDAAALVASPTSPPISPPTPPPNPPPTRRPTPPPQPKKTKRPTPQPTISFRPTAKPTTRPTALGPKIYFVDFPSQSCKTVDKPDWVTEETMYSTKEECCLKQMDWIPLENCLGVGWVETNIVLEPTGTPTVSPTLRPTEHPTLSPTISPTVAPSGAPSAMPSSVPSVEPSSMPSDAPSASPTIAPTTSKPTIAPTSSAPTRSPLTEVPTFAADGTDSMTQNSASFEEDSGSTTQSQTNPSNSAAAAAAAAIRDQYIVELLGWANADMDTSNMGVFSGYQYTPPKPPTETPTSRPTSAPTPMKIVYQTVEYEISELILPVIADATISAKRPSLNFGTHQALAANNGSDGQDQFETLLKFDVSLIDPARPIDAATLSIYVMESCDMGGTFHTTRDSLWDAATVTWDNAPAGDGHTIGSLDAVQAGEWYDIDMTAALAWHSSMSGLSSDYLTVRVETEASKRCLYSSMENGEALAPKMTVEYGEVVIEVPQEADSQGEDQQQQQQQQQQQEEQVIPQTQQVIPVEELPPPVAGDFILLRATDDATVVATSPLYNFGDQDKLVLAFDSFTRGIYDSIVRFDLNDMQHTLPRSAVLSLFALEDCTSAGTFSTTAGNGEWSEDDVTWSTAPMNDQASGGGGFGSSGGVTIGTFGSIQANHWYGFNVVEALENAIRAGKDTVTFRLSSGNMNPCQYSSREGGRAPKLMVAF